MSELEKYQGIYASPEEYRTYGHSNHGRYALPLVIEWNPASILDVGCGWNQFAKACRQNGLTAQGMDFACPGSDIVGSACAIPLPDKSVDLVTSFDTLEHLEPEQVPQALSEMARVSTRFLLSICHVPSRITWRGQNLHPTVQPESWWLEQISNAGGQRISVHPLRSRYLSGFWNS